MTQSNGMKGGKIIVHTDGGSRGNPGSSAVGVVISGEKGMTIKKYSKDIGIRTNNEAEYEAVILAFQKMKQLFGKEKTKNLEIQICMDSELVCRQLKGEYKIEEERFFPLFIKVWNLKIDFGRVSFKEITREENKAADALVNEILNKKEQRAMF